MVFDGEALFLSPHFDDVVLSCSAYVQALPKSIVATVFSGAPDASVPASEWEHASGLRSARDSLLQRREEDREALDLLGAERVLLGFLQAPFRTERIHESEDFTSTCTQAVATRIGALLDERRPDACALPMGIFHDDHLITRNAARLALESRSWCQSLVYRDLPYALERPSVTEAQRKWFMANEPFAPDTIIDSDLKRRAVASYTSQIEPLTRRFGEHFEEIFESGAERIYYIGAAGE